VVAGNRTQRNSSYFAREKAKLPLPGLCAKIPTQWFGERSRLDHNCILFDDAELDSKPISYPSIFGYCANPLEWVVFGIVFTDIVSIDYF